MSDSVEITLFEQRLTGLQSTVRKHRAARAGTIMLSVVVALVAVIGMVIVVIDSRRDVLALVVDETGAHTVGVAKPFEEVHHVRTQATYLAAIGLLNRNPGGFDNAPLVRQMYIGQARTNAFEEMELAAAEFELKRRSWNFKPDNIELLRVKDGMQYVVATGDLQVREEVGGLESDRVYEVTCNFILGRNPEILTVGRFPYAVVRYQYKLKEKAQPTL